MKGQLIAPGGALAAAVKFTARWLDTKPSVPAWGGLLLEVSDGILSVTGFNENSTARASLPVEGDAVGRTVVAGRLIDQIVATFPDKPITIEQDGSLLAISCGKFAATMPSMSENDYPDRPGEAPLAGWVDGDEFADAVRRVGVAASNDVSNSATIARAGIHLAFPAFGGPLTLSTTDTYRVARTKVEWVSDEESSDTAALGESSLVLASTLIDSADVFAGGRIRIGWTKGSLSLTSPDRSLVTREIGSQHPAAPDAAIWRQPAVVSPAHTAVVGAALVAKPMKRVDVLNGPKIDQVWLDFRAGALGLRVHTEISDGGEEIDVEYGGPDCSLLVKSPFLRAALDSAPGGIAHMGISPGPGNKPIVITSPDDPSWVHILAILRKA